MAIGLRLKSFSEFSNLFKGKSAKYLAKQYNDIKIFGTAR